MTTQTSDHKALTIDGKEMNQRKKAYFISLGTFVFLGVSTLLTVGLCKFSFYVLTNHRALATSRDSRVSLIEALPPKVRGTDPVLITASVKNDDAPVFAQMAQTSKDISGVRSVDRTAPSVSQATFVGFRPEIKQPEVLETELPISQPLAFVASLEEKESATSLDDLILSGTNLLEEAEKGILLSQAEILPPFLEEAERTIQATPTPPSLVSPSLAKSVESLVKSIEKAEDKKTLWVDIDSLRRQIQKKSSISSSHARDEEITKANESILSMAQTPQFAQVKGIASDSDKPSFVVEEAPFSGTEAQILAQSSLDASKASLLKAQEVNKQVSNQLDQVRRETNSLLFSTDKNASQGEGLWKVAAVNGKPKNSLATVKPTEESLDALKKLALEETLALQQKNVVPKTELKKEPDPKPVADKNHTVIYRNGKVHKVYDQNGVEKESKIFLEWSDKQQAAVWTSMAQTDVPSVWTKTSDDENTDLAKAFKVALVAEPARPDLEKPVSDSVSSEGPLDIFQESVPAKAQEQLPLQQPAQPIQTQAVPAQQLPAPTLAQEVSLAPIRIVGEQAKPEGKLNPILLPLGEKEPESPPVMFGNAVVSVPPMVLGSNGGIAPFPTVQNQILAKEQADVEAKKQEASEEPDVMKRIFSFFTPSEETLPLPSITADKKTTPFSASPDLNKRQAKPNLGKAKQSDKKSNKTSATEPVEGALAKSKEIQVPTELRLTFKPNSAEMSAQSIKWIKSFGIRAKKDIQSAVEVRMSSKDPDLQNKRFSLIRSVLLGAGMEDVQIVPVHSNRTPHTIVLRSFDMPDEGYEEYRSSASGVEERMYYRQW